RSTPSRRGAPDGARSSSSSPQLVGTALQSGIPEPGHTVGQAVRRAAARPDRPRGPASVYTVLAVTLAVIGSACNAWASVLQHHVVDTTVSNDLLDHSRKMSPRR